MRGLFRRAQEQGISNVLLKIVEVPLNFLRDYSVPMGEEDAWNRTRASILPATLVMSVLYLNGNLQDVGRINDTDDEETKANKTTANKELIVGLISIIPGILIGAIIRLKTKITEAPPTLMIFSTILSFIMSIFWVQFTCNIIMDQL